MQHRTTGPYTPQTNGMVERFNVRIEAGGAGHVGRILANEEPASVYELEERADGFLVI